MNLTKAGKSSFKFRPHGVIASHSTGFMARQSDLFFNGLKFVFLFLLILTTIIFFDLKKVKAQEMPSRAVVINEVYPNPVTGEVEWIELFNVNLQTVILTAYTIGDGTTATPKNLSSYSIPAEGYLVLKQGKDADFGFELNNSGDIIKLKKSGDFIDQVTYGNWDDSNIIDNAPVPPKGQSITRFPNGQDTNNDINDFITRIQPTLGVGIPAPVTLEDPVINGDMVSLAWSDVEPTEFLNYEIYISEVSDELGNIFVDLQDNYYETKDLIPGKIYYFVVRNYNLDGNYSDSDQVFITLPIIYSKNIIINEVYPHPENGADNEFIELYNTGTKPVDISGWFLDDIEGGSTPFQIPNDTPFILPGEYRTFYKNTIEPKTGIILNDDGDMVRLLYPNNEVADTLSYGKADLGLSCVRGLTDICLWTTTPTPKAKNIITVPAVVTDQTDEPVINTVPIEIPTGDYQNYLDKLVKIRGKVISTSGNTFYLDDGSGVIKVYIQEKTGIEKPEMHRNDIFEITGVVDLYGQTWRILPRTLSDITLIEQAPVVTKMTTTKKVVSKAATAIKSPLISKAVAAASTSPPPENKDKNSSLIQLIMTSIGLAVLSLFFLIIKILNQPKVKTTRQIGGHFGDDET